MSLHPSILILPFLINNSLEVKLKKPKQYNCREEHNRFTVEKILSGGITVDLSNNIYTWDMLYEVPLSDLILPPIIAKEVKVWDFVESFYPNYHGSDEILRNDDLTKIVNNEFEDDSIAAKIFSEEFGGDIKKAEIELEQSTVEIYRKSIEAFLKTYQSLL